MKAKSWLIFIFVLILIASSSPVYLWNYDLSYLPAAGVLFFALWEFPKNAKRTVALIMLFIFYLYASIHQYGNPNIFGIVFGLFPFFIYLIKDDNWDSIYKTYFYIYSISMIPSLLVFVLVTILGYDLPHYQILPVNDIKLSTFTVYPFLVVEDNIMTFMRFRAYYDEPGVVGTISGILLVTDRCNMKDWKNWPLLISGIVSFSLFFYLLIFIYVFLFAKMKYKLIFGVCVAIALVYIVTDDSIFSDLILSRLSVEDGEWVGDNRTSDYFDSYWKRFWESDMKWFGYGRRYCQLVADPYGSSYKHVILDLGIIMFGWFVSAIFLFYRSLIKDMRKFLLVLFLFLCTIYQRPMLFNMFGVFMIIAPAIQIQRQSNEDKRSVEKNRYTLSNSSDEQSC